MVDVIKFPLHAGTAFPSNFHNLRSKAFCQQAAIPKHLLNTHNLSQNDRINNTYAKRWMGNYSSDPPRSLDPSNSPYEIHRKIMHQELSRQCPPMTDLERSAKSKESQVNTNKDIRKSATTVTTAITTTISTRTGETNITSQPAFSNGDNRGSRLFDTLSKHVTIKPEPIRPANSFLSNATSTLTSWQSYWTSTHAQRRRKEANDAEPVIHRPKRGKTIPGQIHFVVLRDSPYPYSELTQDSSRAPSIPTPTNRSTPPKPQISPPPPPSTTTFDKPISSKKENDNKKETPRRSTIKFIASLLIPPSTKITSSVTASKTSITIPLKPIVKDDEKHLTEKSLLLSPSSHFISNSQVTEKVSEAPIQPKPIITKQCEPSLPADKPKKPRKSPSRRRARSKSKEEKEPRVPSAAKRKRQASAIQKLKNKLELSTIPTRTTSKSKYSRTKWDEPYIGLRLDPPTPPCSPINRRIN